MDSREREVRTVVDLLTASADPSLRRIVVTADLGDVPTLRLSPGQRLTGASRQTALRFAPGQDGIQISADNQIETLQLFADADRRALFNDTAVERLGRLSLRDLSVTGVVRLPACDRVRSGHVEAHDIDIVAADGAVGIQISQPVGQITVRRGTETYGGTGDSLVKGVIAKLPAIPLSIKPGGSVRRIEIAGGLTARGAGVAPLEVHGRIDTLQVTGGFAAAGGDAT